MSNFMRLIVFFDLPVVTKPERKIYARFRKFLQRSGYDMLQYSIYARICNGQDAVEKHMVKLKANLPKEGSVRSLQVTEKQFAAIQVLVGTKIEKEDSKYASQLLIRIFRMEQENLQEFMSVSITAV